MKKSLLFLASAALVLASCNNDVTLDENKNVVDPNQPKEISFSTYAHTAKHAKAYAPVADAVFPTDYHFYIAAYSVNGGGDYFDKSEYAREGVSGNTWSGIADNKQYWPLSPDTLNFLAVTKAGASTTTFGNTGANYASKVVVNLVDNRTAQHDLMYSYKRADVTKGVGNALVFNGGSNVAMEFHHAQAWVYFTVIAGDDATAGAGLVVTGIQLKQAVYNGTATVNLANYNLKDDEHLLSATLAWDGTAYGSATKYNVDVPTNGGAFVNVDVDDYENAIDAGDGLMIVPNPNKTDEELDPSFTTFVVSYTLNGKAYTFEYTPTAAQKQMMPGYKYNFNITFTLHEIKVNATVDEWDEVENGVDIPAV